MILGIIASSISGSKIATNSYESIATVTGNGSASTLSFTSIPSTYSHLQIRGICRDARAVTIDTAYATFNSDTGTNYADHYLQGNGSTVSAGAEISQNPSNSSLFLVAGSSAGSNMYSVMVMDVLDYASTNKYKTSRILTGSDQNGSGSIRLFSHLWQSTSAITRIDFTTGTSSAWDSNTTFALYGIKA